MKKIILLTALFGLAANASWAEGPGTTSANFLKSAQGGRPVALGETYVAIGDDLDALTWNPAGLSQLSNPSISFMHTFWFEDVGLEYLAYGLPIEGLGTLAGGLTLLHFGTIEQTLEDPAGNYAGTGATYSPLSMALTAGYGQQISRWLPAADGFPGHVLVGASMKFVYENDLEVFGGGVDLGAVWKQNLDRAGGWRLGFTAQNLGVTTDQTLPMNFRGGIGFVAQNLFSHLGQGTLALDVLLPIDNDLKITAGGEYALISENAKLAVRAGYKAGSEIRDFDALAGLTAGGGLAIRAGGVQYALDYAFVPYGQLGYTHRAALTLAFLPASEKPAALSKPQAAPMATKPAAQKIKAKPAAAAPMRPRTKTSTRTATPTRTMTASCTPTFTLTATPLRTATPSPTTAYRAVQLRTLTSTPLPVFSRTATRSPTSTPSRTAIATSTATSSPTSTPSRTATATSSPTSTPSRTATATSTATSSPTSTPSRTAIATSTATSIPTAVTAAARPKAKFSSALDSWRSKIASGLLPGITFQSGRAALTAGSDSALQQIGRLLKKYPKINAAVVGFADNDALALNRAKTVAIELTVNYDISIDRIITQAGNLSEQPANSEIDIRQASQNP